jgi:hypothetical protein
MSQGQPIAERVYDTIPRVDDAVSVGEDLHFQQRWWRFENLAWWVLILVLAADALGVLGRGWLARAQRATADGALHVRYERVERAGTPSEMTLDFGRTAVQGDQIRLTVSETLVNELGAQRVIPQPESSAVGPDGLTYLFPTTGTPATVSFALEPSFPGVHDVTLTASGEQPIHFRILVLP